MTFFVASDTHFGFSAEIERRDLEAIHQMNTMEGATAGEGPEVRWVDPRLPQ